MQAEPVEITRCIYCEKKVAGRKGKLFCDVSCKNNYNSRIRAALRAEENKLFPLTIKKIKANYRILLKYNLDQLAEGKEINVKKDELRAQGFDHRYCTGAHLEGSGKLWKCCFSFCWHEQMNWLTLKYDPTLNNQYSF